MPVWSAGGGSWSDNLRQALADEIEAGEGPVAEQLKAALVARWAPSEAITANDYRLSPDGTIIKRTSTGTTRANWDATEIALWTVVAGGGGGGGAVSSVAGRTGAVTLTADDLTDATTTGKALARAASQAAARSAIGAGTSSFSGAYTDLSGKPTIPAARFVVADPTLADGVTDNRAYLQGLLDSALYVRIPTGTSNWLLSGPLVLSSGQYVDATGAYFKLTQSTQFITNDAWLAASSGSSRDSKITWIGGTLDRENYFAASDNTSTSVLLGFLDGLTLRDIEFKTPAAGTGSRSVMMWQISNFLVDNLSGTSRGAVIQCIGSNTGKIRRITGVSGDDTVAVMPRDDTSYEGPASRGYVGTWDIEVDGVFTTSGKAGVKVLGGRDAANAVLPCLNIQVRNVDGSFSGTGAIIIGGDVGYPGLSSGLIENVTVENVYQRATNINCVDVRATATVRGLIIRNPRANGGYPVIVQTSTIVVDDLTVEGFTYAPANIKELIYVNTAATVTLLRIRNGYLTYGSAQGSLVKVASTAVLKTVIVENVRAPQIGHVLGSYPTVTEFFVRGLSTTNQFKLVESVTGGALTIMEAQISAANNEDVTVTAGTIRSRTLGLRCDVSKLTKNAGDLASNNNAALACGVGPVVSDGTNWKGLYSGVAA